MDRATRRELLATIESQKETVSRYETKLRDLVSAYKGIMKEKAALEDSVKALGAAKITPKVAPAPSNGDQAEKSASEGFDDPLGAQSPEDSSARVKQLQEQLATLTSSLATVSGEKSKMEANFLAEKKKIRLETAANQEQLQQQLDQAQLQVTKLQEDLTEWRTRVRTQQHEREKEQSDHAMMLRELQKLLAEERAAKEQLEHQLDDVRQKLADRQSSPEVSAQYEAQVSILSQELQEVRRRLKSSEDKASKPSPLLLRLQEEMAELKAQHRIAIQQEQRRANEAEDRLQDTARHSEERVSGLEGKLSELSDVVGNYERLRFQDQTAIQKLRERVSQLDLENTALARAAHRSTEVELDDAEDTNLDIQALVDKMTRLKGMLKLANERSEKPVNMEELLSVGSVVGEESCHKRCQEEYEQLKEEFERYKLRAQSVLKNKKECIPSQELDLYKSQVVELKDKLRDVRKQLLAADEQHKAEVNKLHSSMSAMTESSKAEIVALESAHKTRLEELEIEIRRHRDRTVALLAEKDRELELLRSHSQEAYQNQYVTTFRQMSVQSTESESGDNARSRDMDCVSELISKTAPAAETSLLHFAQEQARKDVELTSLRKQKHSLEMALREMQQSFSMKEQKSVEEQEALKEEVRRLERGRSRESANLEYLKNVVYQYMVSWNVEGRQQMLKAIATILQFSPAERQAVEARLQNGWWGKGKSPSGRH